MVMHRFEALYYREHKGGKYLCLFAGRRKSSIVSNCFDVILIPQLSLLYLEYHHLWEHSGYLEGVGGKVPPLPSLKPT